jgi:hypothetical protein
MSFCKKVPGGFDSLQIRSQFADWPSERFEVLQCGPRGSWPARLARRARPRLRPGKGGERVPTSQGFDSGARPGPEEGRRVGLPATGGGDRKELGSGELSAGDRKGAARMALLGPSGGAGRRSAV